METFPIAADGSDSSDANSILQEVETHPVEEFIALNRPKGEIRKPTHYTNMAAYALPAVDDDILVNLRKATKCSESAYWQVAMEDEM